MGREGFFFTQERVGAGGSMIEIRKIRTMKGKRAEDEDEDTKISRAASGVVEYERITLLGFILRVTGIDELPQLINVLLGELNLLGIRAKELDGLLRLSEDAIDFYLRYGPGLFPGELAFGSYNGTLEEKQKNIEAFMAKFEGMQALKESGQYVAYTTEYISIMLKAFLNKIKNKTTLKVVLDKTTDAIKKLTSCIWAPNE